MSVNGDFLNLYNRLDSMLRYLVNGQEGKNYIFFYEKILPFEKRSTMEEIRHFKNSHKSHGVSNNDAPIAARSWVIFLQEQIYFVENNKSIVKDRMIKIINSFDSKNNNRSTNVPRPSSDKKIEESFTKYPFPKWNINVKEFMFYKHLLQSNYHNRYDNYYERICYNVTSAIAHMEDFLDDDDKRFGSNDVYGKQKYIFGEEFKPQDFVPQKMPLEEDVCMFGCRVRLNANKLLWFFFNTDDRPVGSVIMSVWKPDGINPNNWIGKVCGLYYFNLSEDRVIKVLAGKDVHLKTAIEK